jgi:hypothetical protein
MRLKDRLLFSYRDARRLAGSLKRALLRRFLKGKQSGR